MENLNDFSEGRFSMSPTIGFTVGRFQPFHKGHQTIVDTIIKDGLAPLIFIGVGKQSSKSPLPFDLVHMLIDNVYQGISVAPLYDVEGPEGDDAWFDSIIDLMNMYSKGADYVLYYTYQDVDKQNYIYKGTVYKDTVWPLVLKENGISVKEVQQTVHVHARDIRENLDAHREYVHPNVYNILKKTGRF